MIVPPPSADDRPPAGEAPVSGVSEFRRRVLAFGFGAIAVALFVLLVVIYAPVIRPMLWAAALAVLFFPLHRKVFRVTGRRATLSAVISTVLTALIFLLPTFILVNTILAEAQNLWPEVRTFLGPETFQKAAAWVDRSALRPALDWLFPERSGLGPEGIERMLRDLVSEVGSLAEAGLRQVGRGAPQSLLTGAVILLTYFFFLRHGPGWLTQVEEGLPLEREHARALLRIAGETVNAVFRGVVVTAAVQASLAGLAFVVIGVPAPMLLGIMTFVAALVPFVGPVFIWLPTAVALIVTERTTAGIILLAWGALVVSLVDNFLRPYLIGRTIRLPVLWLFLAILGGLRAFGFLGLLLGPAALALFLACYRIYREGRRPPARPESEAKA